MSRQAFLLLLLAIPIAVFLSCSHDEDDLRPPPHAANIIDVEFENAKVIDVDTVRHQALLLTTGEGTSRTAVQLVDLESRTLMASHILTDYLSLTDVKFVCDSLACFAGRPHGFIGYAVQFVSLPSLALSTRLIVTPETTGSGGYLAVDATGTFVYYSHAGGGDRDGVYKIRAADKSMMDADNDGVDPKAFDNQLLQGLFAGPAKLFYDNVNSKLVVANTAFITILDAALWGTLNRYRTDSLSYSDFPDRVRHLTTDGGANPRMMASGAGIYVFGGSSGNQPQLSRFEIGSTILDLTRTLPGVTWWHNNPAIFIQPRADIVSVYVLYEDNQGAAVGQYGLDQLNEVAGSPFRTRTIPDTSISTFGLDVASNRLIVADKDHARLELIAIQ